MISSDARMTVDEDFVQPGVHAPGMSVAFARRVLRLTSHGGPWSTARHLGDVMCDIMRAQQSRLSPAKSVDVDPVASLPSILLSSHPLFYLGRLQQICAAACECIAQQCSQLDGRQMGVQIALQLSQEHCCICHFGLRWRLMIY